MEIVMSLDALSGPGELGQCRGAPKEAGIADAGNFETNTGAKRC